MQQQPKRVSQIGEINLFEITHLRTEDIVSSWQGLPNKTQRRPLKLSNLTIWLLWRP